MKRRNFFGALAGLIGAPAAASMVTVTKEATDTFGHAGQLLDTDSLLAETDYPKPLAREMRMAWVSATCCTMASCYRNVQWDAKVSCKYCGSTLHGARCDGCGARI